MTIKDLKPTVVWNNFYQITRQPRPSKHEEKVREFLLKCLIAVIFAAIMVIIYIAIRFRKIIWK